MFEKKFLKYSDFYYLILKLSPYLSLLLERNELTACPSILIISKIFNNYQSTNYLKKDIKYGILLM